MEGRWGEGTLRRDTAWGRGWPGHKGQEAVALTCPRVRTHEMGLCTPPMHAFKMQQNHRCDLPPESPSSVTQSPRPEANTPPPTSPAHRSPEPPSPRALLPSPQPCLVQPHPSPPGSSTDQHCSFLKYNSHIIKFTLLDFPGGPVVKIPLF